MKVLKNIFSKFYLYLLWAMIAAMLWGWIFSFVTNTTPSKKVTVFINTYACSDTDLAVELEKDKPENIKMIKVHPFSFSLFDSSTFVNGDIYIIKSSEIETYLPSFCPLNEQFRVENPLYEYYYGEDGTAWGIKVYDAATSTGVATEYLTYTVEGAPQEDYYLFFNADSIHIGALNGSPSDAALTVAENLIGMD
ncbi:MAG: hypothetical protein ACI3XE_01485 [Eubacteriales bacterium]